MSPLGSQDEDRTADVSVDQSLEMEWTAEPGDPAEIGRFKVIRRVGKGAMGVVFEGVDPSTHAKVAIKTITRISPEGVYRFKKEFRSLAKFQHRNVVSLYELAQDGEQLYYTMELVRGVDVMRHLCGPPVSVRPKRYRPCRDYDRIRSAFRQLATGVAAIHRAGILHRDIKPSNVLVARDGRVVLLDFGLVREQRLDADVGLTDDGAVLGTPLYMSPEQAVGRGIGKPSDWYGVGAILYHALCGSAPFQGTGVLALLAAKRDEMPPRPQELVPEIPADLDALCWDLLQTNAEDRPDPSEILERLGGSDEDALDVSDSGVALFIGRDGELSSLHAALDTAAGGRPVLALVDGLSGMGKTTLVQRFLAEVAVEPGTVVLTGKCSERESIPYKALDSVMDALSDYLRSRPSNSEARALLPRDAHAVARLFPVLLSVPAVALAPKKRGDDRIDPSEQRRRAFDALRDMLGRLSDDKRLVVYIDDLQWSDVDSMLALDAILRHPDAPRMLLVGTFRTGADRNEGPLARLVRSLTSASDVSIRRITVGPIDATASTSLALRMLGDRTKRNRALAAEVARESEGSPFFVCELVRYARRVEAETESGGDVNKIVRLENVIKHRIESLPSDARRLLDVIAVAGGRVSLGVALQVAQGDANDRKAVARLRAEHLVRTHGPTEDDSVEIYHNRIREAAMKSIDAEELPRIHLEIGKALEADSGADAVALSHHFRQAGEDQLATRHTLAAADQAAEALAFDRAAELYRTALALRALPAEEVPQIEARLADALANAGHLFESARAYLRATEGGDTKQHFEWTRRAAEHLLVSGHNEEGRKVLDKVLKQVGLSFPKSTARAIASLVRHRTALSFGGIRIKLRHVADIGPEELELVDACWTASRGLLFTDGIVAADFHARDLRAALRAGEPVRIIRSVAFEAQTIAALGGTPKEAKAMALLNQAKELAEKLDSPYATGMIHLFEGHLMFHVGEWRKAHLELAKAVKVLRNNCNYVMPEIAYCDAHGTICLLFMGRINELTSIAPKLLERSLERANPYVEGYARGLLGNVVALAPDNVEEAREQLQIYRRDAPKRFEGHMMNYVAQTSALDRYEGKPMESVKRLEEDGPKMAKLTLLRTPQARAEWLLWRGAVAVAGATEAADPKPLLAEADRVCTELIKHGSAFARGYGHLTRAGALGLRDDPEGAVATLRKAIEEFDVAAMEGFAAAAKVRLGDLVGGSEGEELHEAARTYYERERVKRPECFVRMGAPGFVRE